MRTYIHRGRPGGVSLVRYVPGLSLILAGIFIAVFPQILVLLVASVFVFFGLVALSLAWRMRQIESTHVVMEETGEPQRRSFDPFSDWFPF